MSPMAVPTEAPPADCGCGGGSVVTDGAIVQPSPAGDVIMDESTIGAPAIEGDVIPTEAPAVPEAPSEG